MAKLVAATSQGSSEGGGAGDIGDIGLLAMRPDTTSPPTASTSAGSTTPLPVPPPKQQQQQQQQSTATLDLSQHQRELLQRWFVAVGCVNFDLHKGPELEFLAPALDLTTEEKDTIAFSSFPDTAIFDSGHAVFSWRMRTGPVGLPLPAPCERFESQPLSKAESKRTSASAKRRSFFRVGSDSTPAAAPAASSSTPPFPDLALPSPTSGFKLQSSTPSSSQSMGRTQSATSPSTPAHAEIGDGRTGLLGSPEGTTSRLNGSSSHGAMHALFKLNGTASNIPSRSDKDKDKEAHRNHFREFVNLLSRPSQQHANGATGPSSSSDPNIVRSPTFKSINPFSAGSRNSDAAHHEQALSQQPHGSPLDQGWEVVPEHHSPPSTISDRARQDLNRSPAPNFVSAKPASGALLLQPVPATPSTLPLPSPNSDSISQVESLGPSPATQSPSAKGSNLQGPYFPSLALQSSTYVYGYVFFQQRPDASIRRGYFQKSLVLLSHLPLFGMPAPSITKPVELPLLGTMIRIDLSTTKLSEVSSQDVPYEEAPVTSSRTKSGKSSTRPGSSSSQSASRTLATSEKTVPAINNKKAIQLPDNLSPRSSILETLPGDLLSDLWLLWECLLIGEPIIVLGPEPCAASSAVWHLHNLLQPLRLGADWRPYMNLNDRDFAHVLPASGHLSEDAHSRKSNVATTVSLTPHSSIGLLGVSNPFFVQSPACCGWTVLRVEGCSDAKIERPSGELARVMAPTATPQAAKVGLGSTAASANGSSAGTGVGKGGSKAGHAGGAAPAQHAPGLTSRRKRRVHKDRVLLKQLTELVRDGQEGEAVVLIRAHFEDLTRKFLAPLDSFFARVIAESTFSADPAAATGSTDGAMPFDSAAFMAYLKNVGSLVSVKSRGMNLHSFGAPSGPVHGSALASTSGAAHASGSGGGGGGGSSSGGGGALGATRASLYLDFIRGPNFAPWWNAKWREARWETSLRGLESAVRPLLEGGSQAGAGASGEAELNAVRCALRSLDDELKKDATSLGLLGCSWQIPAPHEGRTSASNNSAPLSSSSVAHMPSATATGPEELALRKQQEQQQAEDDDLGTHMMRGASKMNDDHPALASRLFPPTSTSSSTAPPAPHDNDTFSGSTRTDPPHTDADADADAAFFRTGSNAILALYLLGTADERTRATLRRLEEARVRARACLLARARVQ
ncbi:hypothetical protein OC835_006786 [Tilletia horrida]|nr:hypothetical protein OC835_006786 [Tilletia horrida]